MEEDRGASTTVSPMRFVHLFKKDQVRQIILVKEAVFRTVHAISAMQANVGRQQQMLMA
jgi:hypothetical protein